MSPLFSIIIPVYNVEAYLRDCLDSVLAQTFTDYEAICINDGSTDESLAILEEYEKNHSNMVVINVENGGTASARNIGIKAAKGKYLWFVDSDDWIIPDALQSLACKLGDEPDVLAFNGKLYYEADGHEEQDKPIVDKPMSGWEYYNKYALMRRKFHFVCVVLRLYKHSFIIENNLFFEKGIAHEDNLWIPIVFFHAKTVKFCEYNVYVYRIREGSKMQTVNKNKIFDIVIVANLLSDFFIPKGGIDKKNVYREIAGEYFKGFMAEEIQKYGNNDKVLREKIHWDSFRTVAVYPRHKRIYRLLRFHPVLFRWYVKIETLMKK